MQKRLCGTNVDQDVEVMLSPSKLAAQRIYATKRNSISFHAALQSGSPESAMATFEKPVQDTVPVVASQKPTFPTMAVEYYPPIQEPPPDAWQCATRNPDSERMHQLRLENAQQYKLVQQQIDLLRKVMANSNNVPTPVIVQVPVPPPSQPQPVAATVAQTPPPPLASTVTGNAQPTQDNTWLTMLTKLVFAAVFLVGLLRIVEWLVEKIANFIAPSEKLTERLPRSSSRSSSASK